MSDSNPFDGLAARYQANRPDYPESLLAELAHRVPETHKQPSMWDLELASLRAP